MGHFGTALRTGSGLEWVRGAAEAAADSGACAPAVRRQHATESDRASSDLDARKAAQAPAEPGRGVFFHLPGLPPGEGGEWGGAPRIGL